MSNNYIQFHTELKTATKDQADWLYQLLTDIDNEEDDLLHMQPMLADTADLFELDVVNSELCEWDCDVDSGEFEFWSEDTSAPELLAVIVQSFFRQFGLTSSCFGIDFAYTSSKSSGGFGGGALFVTHKGIESNYTLDWLENKRERFSEMHPIGDSNEQDI